LALYIAIPYTFAEIPARPVQQDWPSS
jgi:hypothetical protein